VDSKVGSKVGSKVVLVVRLEGQVLLLTLKGYYEF
jgi:hypothetical protein